jgi:hypothetical protein
MNIRPKRIPRLWCARQGLLPLDAPLADRGTEKASPPEPASPRSWPDLERERVGNPCGDRPTEPPTPTQSQAGVAGTEH